jgi:beta-glucanase (GH16 family)|tara:strand:+ start:367 stop:1986 length:1620 start_codon:yes stop_codon:yes gene_type:complete
MKDVSIILFSLITLFTNGQTVEDNFEGNGTISNWGTDESEMNTSYTNPYKESINTSNTVLEYKDNGGAYANIFFDVSNTFDLSINHIFTLKIYVPSASITKNENNQISLKLQDNTLGDKWTTQTEIIKPIVLDEWQIITFDFKNDSFLNYNDNSPDPINRTDYNRVLIQINGENNNAKVTAYIDDFLYDGILTDSNDNNGEDPIFDNLVWSDEFNGTGAIDINKWFHQTELPIGGSWYNSEVQHYTNREENSFVENGNLHIVAKKETFTDQGYTKQYTSARLNSKYAFTYGKVQIRAKLPVGSGTWPAIWMLGKNITEPGGYWTSSHGTTPWPACGEIDIMEHWGNNQNYVSSAMHTPSSSGGTINHGGQIIPTASSAFHLYELIWTSEKMVFSVDGIVHYTYNPETKNSSTWPYGSEQYFLLNIAIQQGGTQASYTESAMEIDYVRVYQEATASVSEINNVINVKLFPNPVNDKLNIQFSSDLGEIKGTIYSLTGQKIQVFIQNSLKKTIDISDVSEGIYFIKLETEKGTSTHKIVKK